MRGRAVTAAAARGGVLLCGAVLLLAGCGGGAPAQDENEPEGEFEVDVREASFPEDQKLAKDSRLEVEVENVDTRTIPNVNVTVRGFTYKLRDPDNPAEIDPNVADPERPVFVVEKSPVEFQRNRFREGSASLVDREVNPPAGSSTAYVDTYGLGELEPGDTALFRWDVSAVRPGPFEVRYEVSAGFDGRARAVSDGEQPSGNFQGTIESAPPDARVASDGETIVTEDGRRITGEGRDVLTNP